MTVSAYPAAVDALLGIFNAAFPTGVRVIQGPGASDTSARKFIHVGLQSLDEATFPGSAGEGGMVWATMATNHSRDERFGVNCVARVWSGGKDATTRRDDTFALFGAIVTALQADPSIGKPGGVLVLETYTWSYAPLADGDGTSGVMNFTLNFRARI